ncbi:MAG: hypothetical protein ACLFWB_02200, partial [Armatimonadota bacterium]
SQQALILELAAAGLCRPQGQEPAAAPKAAPQAQQPAAAATQKQPAPRQQSEDTAEKETPAPGPQPAAETEADVGEFSLASLAANWDRVIDEFGAMGHIPAGAIVRQGRPVEYDDGTLTIGFAPSDEFHHNSVRDSYTGLLVEAVERLYGESVSVECRLFEDRGEFDRAVSEAASATTEEEISESPTTGETGASGAAEKEAQVPEAPAPEPEQPKPPPAEPGTEEPKPAGVMADEAPEQTEQAQDEDSESAPQPRSADEVVSQALNLFEGSTEVDEEEDEQD